MPEDLELVKIFLLSRGTSKVTDLLPPYCDTKSYLIRFMQKFYDSHNNRLVLIGEAANCSFWDEHWNVTDFKKAATSVSKYNMVVRLTRKYLNSTNGAILEGGCGTGQNVIALIKAGFECIGVDYAKETVKRINELIPEVDVRYGDVRKLAFDDNYFAGYWSLGVIEHFLKGYDEILLEAKRVLKRGGYLFIAFPYMSPLRTLKAKLNRYPSLKNDKLDPEIFYQYAFDYKQVLGDANKLGLKLRYKRAISGVKGFKDEVVLFNGLLQKIFDYEGKSFLIKGMRFCLDRSLSSVGAGHMMLLVLEREK